MDPEKYMQNFLYLLDMSIFANDIFQNYDVDEEEEDVCKHLFMRRFIAFIRFSKGVEIQTTQKSSPTFHFKYKTWRHGLT